MICALCAPVAFVFWEFDRPDLLSVEEKTGRRGVLMIHIRRSLVVKPSTSMIPFTSLSFFRVCCVELEFVFDVRIGWLNVMRS